MIGGVKYLAAGAALHRQASKLDGVHMATCHGAAYMQCSKVPVPWHTVAPEMCHTLPISLLHKRSITELHQGLCAYTYQETKPTTTT